MAGLQASGGVEPGAALSAPSLAGFVCSRPACRSLCARVQVRLNFLWLRLILQVFTPLLVFLEPLL